MAQLKFYKLSAEAMAQKTVAEGAIWFNKDQKTIEVYNGTSWEKFAGSLEDATWANDVLTIKKYDGSKLELDFSNVASTTSVVEALGALKSELIGAQGDAATASTVYGAKAYADAAVAAEAEIARQAEKENKDAIDVLNGSETEAGSVAKAVKDAIDAEVLRANGAYDASGAAADVKSAIDEYTVNGKKISENPVLGAADIAYTESATVSAAIAALETAVGEGGSVATQIQSAIEGLDAEITSTDGSHVTVKVTEVDGKITAVNVTESDIASAEAVAANTAAITKLNGAASEAGSVAKAVADAKAEILGDAAADFNTLGKLEDKIQAVEGAAKSYSIASVTGDELTALGANVKEAYKLVDEDSIKAGEYIKIYKDSSLQKVELVEQELQFTYLLADGSESTVGVDVSKFLAESEFAAGLQVVDHVVSVKVDETSESFLTVGLDGVKLSGVQDAIDTAIAGVNTTIEENERVTAEALTDLDSRVDALEGIGLDSVISGFEGRIAANEAAVATVDSRISAAEGRVDAKLANKANAADVYTKGEVDGIIAGLDSTATASDTYASFTVAEVDGKVVNEGSSISITTGNVADGANGLAVASDVKTYVDNTVANSLLWEEFN